MSKDPGGGHSQNNHWLPAAFLARFSAHQSGPSRQRSLYTLSRGDGEPQLKTAKTVASEADRYFLTLASNAKAVDEIWSYYERRLNSALDRLVALPADGSDGYISTLEWLTVLVPFVAAAMVRAPDFDRRYNARFGATDGVGLYHAGLYDDDVDRYFASPEAYPIQHAEALTEAERPDNLNRARIIELLRLLPRVFTAEWYVLHTPADGTPFVLPDSGYISGGPRAVVPECMLTVPVGPNHAIALGHRWWNTVATGRGHEWVTAIRHLEVPQELAIQSNLAAARECEQFVVGGGEEELTDLAETMTAERLVIEDSPWLLATPRDVLQLTEIEWYKLVSVIAKYGPGDLRLSGFEKDWGVVRRYVKTVMMTANRPYLDHIVLGTNDDYTAVFSSLPFEVNRIGEITEIKYVEGSPADRISGTVATLEEARQAEAAETGPGSTTMPS